MLRTLLYSIFLLTPVVISFAFYESNALTILERSSIPIIFSIFLVWLSQPLKSWQTRFLCVYVPSLAVFILEHAELTSYYLQGESFNNAFFFHLRPDVLAVGLGAYKWLTILMVLPPVIVAFADIKFLFRKKYKNSLFRLPNIFVASFLICFFIASSDNVFSKFTSAYFTDFVISESQAELFSKASELGMNVSGFNKSGFTATQQGPAKNLVLIYLESLEQAYLDSTRFPDLTPNLNRARSNSLEFTDLNQYNGTTFTMGGMFSSQCGFPLLSARKGNPNDSLHELKGFNRFICLGDILEQVGYYQVFMGGAKGSFSGKAEFYKNHGYDEVNSFEELSLTIDDKEYTSWWGLYDDTLSDIVLTKYKELEKNSDKFALTLLTLDTHHPNGNASRSCPVYEHSDNTMLQAVYCTDFLFGKMLDELEQSENYKNTLIFVMSDHLAMRNVATEFYPPRSERKLLAFALNADAKGKNNTPGSHFDITPTIVDLLHIDTDLQMPFGESLISNVNKENNRFRMLNNQQGRKIIESIVVSLSEPVMLCPPNEAIAINANNTTIHLGSRNLVMSSVGIRMLPDKENLMFIAQASNSGIIKTAGIRSALNVNALIEESPDDIFLIFTKTDNSEIPSNLWSLSDNELNKEWLWYFGNPSSKEDSRLIYEDNIEDFSISSEECRERLAG